jgi:hypothetical protein
VSDMLLIFFISILVVSVNVLINRFLFKKSYDDASKNDKIIMDVMSLGIVVLLFFIYMIIISNI